MKICPGYHRLCCYRHIVAVWADIKRGQDKITADTAFLCYLERVAAGLSLTFFSHANEVQIKKLGGSEHKHFIG